MLSSNTVAGDAAAAADARGEPGCDGVTPDDAIAALIAAGKNANVPSIPSSRRNSAIVAGRPLAPRGDMFPALLLRAAASRGEMGAPDVRALIICVCVGDDGERP